MVECPICYNEVDKLYKSDRFGECCLECMEYGDEEDMLQQMYQDAEQEYLDSLVEEDYEDDA